MRHTDGARQNCCTLAVTARSGTAADVQGEVPAETKAPAESTRPPARTAAPTVADREIESRRRHQQLAEAEKKAADEEARKAQAAENCERLRGYLRALEGGFRIARIDAAGKQEILDDAARTAERERTRAQIEQQCQLAGGALSLLSPLSRPGAAAARRP